MPKKKKNQKKQKNISQSVAVLTANGLQAFRQNDLEKALLSWEKIPANLRPAVLLAKGHFARPDAVLWPKCPDRFEPPANRCCLSAKGSMLCLSLGPGEASPGRHHGRAGGLSNRSPICRAVCHSAAYPLALALLQNGQDPAVARGMINA